MLRENELNKVLKQHEKRISALEAAIGKSQKSKTVQKKQSLSSHIIGLRDNGFFTQPKTAEETTAILKSKYHCENDRVAMSLLRLAKRKELRKATKVVEEKKYKAYVW